MVDTIHSVVTKFFKNELEQSEVNLESVIIDDDLVLLQSGLDSIGFAVLVAKLEEELKYDPFLLMEKPTYPTTFKEFVDIYEKFASHRK